MTTKNHSTYITNHQETIMLNFYWRISQQVFNQFIHLMRRKYYVNYKTRDTKYDFTL